MVPISGWCLGLVVSYLDLPDLVCKKKMCRFVSPKKTTTILGRKFRYLEDPGMLGWSFK